MHYTIGLLVFSKATVFVLRDTMSTWICTHACALVCAPRDTHSHVYTNTGERKKENFCFSEETKQDLAHLTSILSFTHFDFKIKLHTVRTAWDVNLILRLLDVIEFKNFLYVYKFNLTQ